jgi:hypothetical protein
MTWAMHGSPLFRVDWRARTRFLPARPREVPTAETRPGKTWERNSKRAGELMFSDRIAGFRDRNRVLVVSVRSVSVKTDRPVDLR